MLAVIALLVLSACAGAQPVQQERTGPPEDDLEAILATTALRTGAQRVAFLLTSTTSLVTEPTATVLPVYLPGKDSPPEPGEPTEARFYLWPYGTRGTYTTRLTFPQPGNWRLDISLPQEDGTLARAHLPIIVREAIPVPDVDSQAPRSHNKTIWDVSHLRELTSAYQPDPALYQQTIAQALDSGVPLMVVFSSPAFCSSPTCGPQAETVASLEDRYRDRASFIHVEVYDNPLQVQGDLTRARLSPTVKEWGLDKLDGWTNESWVFVVDSQGTVTAKFEAYTSEAELEEALQQALATGRAATSSNY